MSFTEYNWNRLDREKVRDGVERVGFRGEDVICVMNWLTPGMAINPHRHDFEQLVFIIQGNVRFHLDGEVVDATAGSMIRIPAGVTHHAEPIGNDVALNLDVFSPVRPDYLHLVSYQQEEFLPKPDDSRL